MRKLKNLLKFNYKRFDFFIPKSILNQDQNNDYSAKRKILQARAVIAITISALVVLSIQLLIDLYLSFWENLKNHDDSNTNIIKSIKLTVISWPISLTGLIIYSGLLCLLPTEKITISQVARIGICFFLSISAYISCLGHRFAKQTTIAVIIMYLIAFVRSIGKESLPLSFYYSGSVLCDIYLLCFIYFLLVAYDHEYQSNEEKMLKSLNETHLNETQRALLGSIESCGKNLILVVNQVLTFAKVEHGKFSLGVGDDLAPIPDMKKLDFVVYADINPLHRFLVGDVGALRQIILNLLGNALKFTTKGRIELRATELKESADDQKFELQTNTLKSASSEPSNNIAGISSNVPGSSKKHSKEKLKPSLPKAKFLIEVYDTGRGISPEFIDHMYQPFTQNSSLTRRFEGTGLGLSIVKGLLDMMNSKLDVESILGKGSRFSFLLEMPVSQIYIDNISPTTLPFDLQNLRMPELEQQRLIKELKSISLVIFDKNNFLLAQKVEESLMRWGFVYNICDDREHLRNYCRRNNDNDNRENGDVIIFNDNLEDLKCSYQSVENVLNDYESQSVVLVVTKPVGRMKFFTAILKASESLKSPLEKMFTTSTLRSHDKRYSTFEVGPGGEILFIPNTMELARIASQTDEGTPSSEISEPDIYIPSPITTTTEATDRNNNILWQKQKTTAGDSTTTITGNDDNNVNAMLSSMMLKQHGYRKYETANNGLEAVKKFYNKHYDIIFMDIQMPICDGIEATKEFS
nr:5715_t:CDS:10 [Entrophospora candida]